MNLPTPTLPSTVTIGSNVFKIVGYKDEEELSWFRDMARKAISPSLLLTKKFCPPDFDSLFGICITFPGNFIFLNLNAVNPENERDPYAAVRTTLLHEIIEAITSIFDLKNVGETTVRVLEQILWRAFDENPEILSFIWPSREKRAGRELDVAECAALEIPKRWDMDAAQVLELPLVDLSPTC